MNKEESKIFNELLHSWRESIKWWKEESIKNREINSKLSDEQQEIAVGYKICYDDLYATLRKVGVKE